MFPNNNNFFCDKKDIWKYEIESELNGIENLILF